MSYSIRFRLLSISAISCVLASCTTPWTDAQRSSLSTLAVSPSIAPNAYGTPNGSTAMSAPTMVATGGDFASGAAVGAGAQLGVEIVAAVQQKMYASRYADAIAKAPGTVPADLSSRIRQTMAKKLASQPFFRDKIRDNSPNRFQVIVERYRYVRAGKANDEILMTPCLAGRFELVNSGGEKLLEQRFVAVSASYQRPLPEFVRDKQLASKAFDEAINLIAIQAADATKAKVGK